MATNPLAYAHGAHGDIPPSSQGNPHVVLKKTAQIAGELDSYQVEVTDS